MKGLITAVAAVALLAAAACSFSEPTRTTAPSAGALPPPEDAAEPAPESSGAAATESAAGGGGVVIETIEPDPAVAAVPTAVTIPEGAGWTHPEIPLTEQQEDVEACFRFASAQVARESRIDEDRYDSRADRDVYDLWGEPTLTRRVDYYSERRRRGTLFDSCMQSKGYIKN
ncbi:MAG: hypothetical protein R3285_05410 [Kiloniellales bacterium]|nr:hypothetical protein [Kiloniellales bacterium]